MKKSKSYNLITFRVGAALALVIFNIASASDPSPLQDICVATNDPEKMVYLNGKFCKDPKTVTADDFYYSGLDVETNTSSIWGSDGTIVDLRNMPGIYTLGVSIGRNEYAPSGVKPPHTNPRGSEIMLVLEGTLYVGFVSSDVNKNRLYTKTLVKGDVFVFPKGLVHFQMNLGHTRAVAITAWGGQSEGFNVLPSALFATTPLVNPSVLAKSFHVRVKDIEYLQDLPWPKSSN